jgi:oligogalacturonide transporter
MMSGTVTKNKKVTLIHKLAYGSGNMLGSGALAISGAWLLYFYTTFCNMSVVKATLIFSIATYLDVILNSLMGFITDSFYRTKLGRKFGRRRFFILTGIPLMLLYPMLWVKNMNFFYYLTTYILFEFVYTSRMKLNHKTHKIVIDELDRVHAGGRKEDVSEETRNVIEKLTGISYDKCFGNNNIGYKE